MLTLNKVVRTDGSVRLVGRWAWLTGVLGSAYAAFIILIIIMGMPYGYNLLNQICTDQCFYGQLNAVNAQDLHNIGISTEAYATVYLAVLGITMAICLAAGAFILLKKPGELLPFSAALFIFTLPTDSGQFVFFSGLFQDHPTLRSIYEIVAVPDAILGSYLFITFPSGKFKGKVFVGLWGGLVLGYILNYLYLRLAGPAPDGTQPAFLLGYSIALTVMTITALFILEKNFSRLNIAKYLGLALLIAVCLLIGQDLTLISIFAILLYRYANVLTPRERNAAKWLLWSNSVLLFVLIGILNGLTLIPALLEPGTYYFLIFYYLLFFICAVNETGVFLGIFYSNAFDINLVIKRTIVYTALTFMVIGIYIGSVIGLQALVRAISGQQSDLAIVGATLVSVILFQPLRKAIQSFVDRRFYRHKYNAARTIAELHNQLRNEMDLQTLALSLRAVLNETLEPEVVTVWFKKKA